MITSYATLLTAVASFFGRSGDAAFVANIPLFVQLAEDHLRMKFIGYNYDVDGNETIYPLSDATTSNTNWLFEAFPSIYLYATLVEACAYVVEDERLPMWTMKRDEFIADAMWSMSKEDFTDSMERTIDEIGGDEP